MINSLFGSSSIKLEFDSLLEQKGWDDKTLATQWDLSDRQARRIIAKPKQRDLDALKGLPYLITQSTVERSKEFLQKAGITDVYFVYRVKVDGQLEIKNHSLPEEDQSLQAIPYLQNLLILGKHLNDLNSEEFGIQHKSFLFTQVFLYGDTINTAKMKETLIGENWTMLEASFGWDVTTCTYDSLPYSPLSLFRCIYGKKEPEHHDYLYKAIAFDVICEFLMSQGVADPFANSRTLTPHLYEKVKILDATRHREFLAPPIELIDSYKAAIKSTDNVRFIEKPTAYLLAKPSKQAAHERTEIPLYHSLVVDVASMNGEF